MIARITLLASLLPGAVLGNIVGSYKATGVTASKACSTCTEVIFTESHTIVKTDCNNPNAAVTFGKWVQTSPTTIQEFLIDGSNKVSFQETPYTNSITYGDLSLQKAEPSALALNAVGDMFGDWKAVQPQSEEDCSIISELSIMNSGQIIRYYCKGIYKRWFERGFFKISSYSGSQVDLVATFNGTAVPITIMSEDSNKLTYEKVILLRSN